MNNQNGIALVMTLLVMALLTAMAVEFSYGVYTGTNDLYNWRDSQRLSVMARSGVNFSARYIRELKDKFTEPVDMSVQEPSEDFKGEIRVRIEDETGKLNLNSLVGKDGRTHNRIAYKTFQRLLEVLSLDRKIADRVTDWIDSDSTSEVAGSEAEARNQPLDSVDELMLINGINRTDYDKLLPYVTVFGTRNNLIININTAGEPVLMSLYDDVNGNYPINADKAKNLVIQRKNKPFASIGDFNNMAGTSFSVSQITSDTNETKIFAVHSAASSGKVKRIIDMVMENGKIKYWREY